MEVGLGGSMATGREVSRVAAASAPPREDEAPRQGGDGAGQRAGLFPRPQSGSGRPRFLPGGKQFLHVTPRRRRRTPSRRTPISRYKARARRPVSVTFIPATRFACRCWAIRDRVAETIVHGVHEGSTPACKTCPVAFRGLVERAGFDQRGEQFHLARTERDVWPADDPKARLEHRSFRGALGFHTAKLGNTQEEVNGS